MEPDHIVQISTETGIRNTQVAAAAGLIEQGATVPFIARYRKEATGSLDEVAITRIRDRLRQLDELDRRKETVLTSLAQHGHLTDELEDQVRTAATLSAVEDLYLPFKPKRRTRATIAREKGLEPLALALLAQEGNDPIDIAGVRIRFVTLPIKVTYQEGYIEDINKAIKIGVTSGISLIE